jgi:carboxymethylenebutenolidase
MERKKASDFPQELLGLFDRYVHGGIDRREFLDGAQKFAVGGMTAAALFEMLKPNYAWAVQVQKDDTRIKAESATVPSPQGNGISRATWCGRRMRPEDWPPSWSSTRTAASIRI